jgi:hypothetical protein
MEITQREFCKGIFHFISSFSSPPSKKDKGEHQILQGGGIMKLTQRAIPNLANLQVNVQVRTQKKEITKR